MGHKKIDSIQLTHLNEFYKNLAEPGIRFDYKYKLKESVASDIVDFKKKASYSDINIKTLQNIIKGGNTIKTVADKICSALYASYKNIRCCQYKYISFSSIHDKRGNSLS